MILAEKISTLRKKNGWSQEELAERLDVSRQSVSKWESGQSVPELDKIVQMSELFGVSTDQLIKDEELLQTHAEGEDTTAEKTAPPETLSHDELQTVLRASRKRGLLDAVGTALCILSPCLLILEHWKIGTPLLLVMVAIAVACFVIASHLWTFTPKRNFSAGTVLSAQAAGFVRENSVRIERKVLVYRIVGLLFCILCAVPMLAVAAFTDGNVTDTLGEWLVVVLLAMVAVGVAFLIQSEMERGVWRRLQVLTGQCSRNDLDEDPFEEEDHRISDREKLFQSIFWPTVTIGYLLVSFLTGAWHITWIVWPVAGIFSGIVHSIFLYLNRSR